MKAAQKKGAVTGAPAWMVTFADLMALLLVLFVLMLSFSVTDAQQYKKMAGTMKDAFGLSSINRLLGVFQMEGISVRTDYSESLPMPVEQFDLPPEEPEAAAEEIPEEPAPPVSEEAAKEAAEALEELDEALLEKIKEVMAQELEREDMELEGQKGSTVIRFPASVAFAAGSERLGPDFEAALEKLLGVLEESEGEIIVAGHTDDRPISTQRFRSNWDLSTARAVSVIHYITKHSDIDISRLAAQGMADSRPLAANDSPENRAKNRRVEITISDGAEEVLEALPDNN